MPMTICFEHLGPSLGWAVKINDIGYIRFTRETNGWCPHFHRLPEWITMAELSILEDMLKKLLTDTRKSP